MNGLVNKHLIFIYCILVILMAWTVTQLVFSIETKNEINSKLDKIEKRLHREERISSNLIEQSAKNYWFFEKAISKLEQRTEVLKEIK